ncbi:hypothetical protein R1sor_020971 [Riccia sorocarpa]|uniref:Uncharacterized protein n=1 Tax=Riccia sorocarpa TaxID=122646 RepID=A0ABD3GFP4_9MARC
MLRTSDTDCCPLRNVDAVGCVQSEYLFAAPAYLYMRALGDHYDKCHHWTPTQVSLPYSQHIVVWIGIRKPWLPQASQPPLRHA